MNLNLPSPEREVLVREYYILEICHDERNLDVEVGLVLNHGGVSG